jgi:hypothetical protein
MQAYCHFSRYQRGCKGYSSELNPDERLNADLKYALGSRVQELNAELHGT